MFRFDSPIPSSASISSGFAVARPSPAGGGGVRAHQGLDFRAPIGTPVVAAADGIVARTETGRVNIPKGRKVSSSERAGNLVTLGHPDGWSTRHYHLSRVDVRPGQSVRQGQQIGLTGNSGSVNGPHLHFETWQSATPQNPLLVTNVYDDDPDASFRVATGEGGYVYRQWADGQIDVIESPDGSSMGRLSPEDPKEARALVAIRDEIGPWDGDPTPEAPVFVDATPAPIPVPTPSPDRPDVLAPRRSPLLALVTRDVLPALPKISTSALALFGLSVLGTTIGLIVADNLRRPG